MSLETSNVEVYDYAGYAGGIYMVKLGEGQGQVDKAKKNQ